MVMPPIMDHEPVAAEPIAASFAAAAAAAGEETRKPAKAVVLPPAAACPELADRPRRGTTSEPTSFAGRKQCASAGRSKPARLKPAHEIARAPGKDISRLNGIPSPRKDRARAAPESWAKDGSAREHKPRDGSKQEW